MTKAFDIPSFLSDSLFLFPSVSNQDTGHSHTLRDSRQYMCIINGRLLCLSVDYEHIEHCDHIVTRVVHSNSFWGFLGIGRMQHMLATRIFSQADI